jgi:hypothetical protein
MAKKSSGLMVKVMTGSEVLYDSSSRLRQCFTKSARAYSGGDLMPIDIKSGDQVKLLSLPDWMTHDLPLDEQTEMHSFVGQSAKVEKIDAYGYYWLGFGSSFQVDGNTYYSGHSFGVPRESIERDAG